MENTSYFKFRQEVRRELATWNLLDAKARICYVGEELIVFAFFTDKVMHNISITADDIFVSPTTPREILGAKDVHYLEHTIYDLMDGYIPKDEGDQEGYKCSYRKQYVADIEHIADTLN